MTSLLLQWYMLACMGRRLVRDAVHNRDRVEAWERLGWPIGVEQRVVALLSFGRLCCRAKEQVSRISEPELALHGRRRAQPAAALAIQSSHGIMDGAM